jgi:hypothetical protein
VYKQQRHGNYVIFQRPNALHIGRAVDGAAIPAAAAVGQCQPWSSRRRTSCRTACCARRWATSLKADNGLTLTPQTSRPFPATACSLPFGATNRQHG